jgi:hypothetical protein
MGTTERWSEGTLFSVECSRAQNCGRGRPRPHGWWQPRAFPSVSLFPDCVEDGAVDPLYDCYGFVSEARL